MTEELLPAAFFVAVFITWRAFEDAISNINTNRTATHVNALISLLGCGVAAMCAIGLFLPYLIKR